MNKGKRKRPETAKKVEVPQGKRPTKHPHRGSKRSTAQAESDRAFLAAGMARGLTYAVLHERLNEMRKGQYTIGRRTIDDDAKKIRDAWYAAQLTNITAQVNKELALLDYLQNEALDAWDRSKTEMTRTEAESANFTDAGRRAGTRQKVTRNNRDGDPQHLAIALKCHERRCRLLGMEKHFAPLGGDPLAAGEKSLNPAGMNALPSGQHMLEIRIISEQEAHDIAASAPAT